jgi:hypothetical protein
VAGKVISVLSLVVATLAVFFGPLEGVRLAGPSCAAYVRAYLPRQAPAD